MLDVLNDKSPRGGVEHDHVECGRKLKRQGKYSVKTDSEEGKTDGKD